METFVAFDLETTGLSPEYNNIIEIGAVKVVNGVVTDTFHTLVNPRKRIPYEASRVNHITDEMVRNSPGIECVFSNFINFIDSAILVAHNAQFDMGFIKKEAHKNDILIDNPVECTVKLARKVLKGLPSYSLDNLTKHFNITIKNKHRALDDAMGTAKLYIKLQEIGSGNIACTHAKENINNNLSKNTGNGTNNHVINNTNDTISNGNGNSTDNIQRNGSTGNSASNILLNSTQNNTQISTSNDTNNIANSLNRNSTHATFCNSLCEFESNLIMRIKNKAYLERILKAIQLIESGTNIDKIAELVGVTPVTLANYCVKLRIEYGYNYWNHVKVSIDMEKRVTDLLIAGECRCIRDFGELLGKEDTLVLFWTRLVLDKNNVNMEY